MPIILYISLKCKHCIKKLTLKPRKQHNFCIVKEKNKEKYCVAKADGQIVII